MPKLLNKVALALSTSVLVACSATPDITASQSPDTTPQVQAQILKTEAVAQIAQSDQLTLNKIMADPDWIGRQPERPYWGDDSQSVFYSQKRQSSQTRDVFVKHFGEMGNGQQLNLASLHEHSYRNRVVNNAGTHSAWVFENSIFVKSLQKGSVVQLTRDNEYVSNLMFMKDGALAFKKGDRFYRLDANTGQTSLLASWRFADKPRAVKPAKDYIAEQQHRLIQVVAKKREQRAEKEKQTELLQRQNLTLAAEAFYLPKKHRLVEASLSPDGQYVLLSIRKDSANRSDGDIMPNYIQENGRIKSDKVRARVADTKPRAQILYLLNLKTGKKTKLNFSELPGYNEDVLEAVKRENAEAVGETYETNRLPREIGLMVDWGWSQSAIQWNNDGSKLAVMLEAWDNKDRWLTTLDLADGSFTTQHRLHDDAWVNYTFNEFGWLNDGNGLYYLSEESGYSHLYLKPLESQARALTSGRFEVSSVTLSDDDKHFYFKANKKHPGIYEIYRVPVAGGELQALTDLNGMTDYQLSPDESKLLLSHSKLDRPPELYVQGVAAGSEANQITQTVSEQFKAVNWVKPQIVPVPSSHGAEPIYARLYLPEGYAQGEKRRAVVFSHGAGYLQNAHLGWSGYFREYMFHSLLVQQGYVVLDMDYRASKGYGRDWRTAIYRQMGTPEVEDLVDGVNWIVENANVDRQRIGHYGGSYGGFMTFMAMFNQPDLFQAGAALRPVSDWAHYNHPYTSNILNTPDIDPIAYERSSPIYFAEGLEKPLLINAPMVDSNVFFVDVVRLVQRFIELEKEDFETAIYPVESHGFVQPSSWLDEYRRIHKLFEENL